MEMRMTLFRNCNLLAFSPFHLSLACVEQVNDGLGFSFRGGGSQCNLNLGINTVPLVGARLHSLPIELGF